MTNAATMTRSNDTATLRALVAAAGLRNVRVRAGTGCRRGAVHLYMGIDATREDREAAAAFLVRVSAVVSYGTPVEVAKRPEVLRFFDSATVLSFVA